MKPANKDEIRQRYLAVDTSNVADVLDTLGYLDQGLSSDFAPFPAQRDGTRLAGWAYTIRRQMTPFPLGGDDDKMQACQGLSAGEISVWSGDGICYFGELIALGMKERGCVGAVLDGGIRDVRWIGQHGFQIFARYRTPVQSIGRWKVTAWQVPVVLRGATSNFVSVKPGDVILGDDDGAIVIPAPLVEQVLVESERLTATETAIRTQLSEGLTLAEALAKYGHV
jgi:regulator of RNase E activity RraA